jgi:cyclopropane fatty-acyl-phospholipid synthase-like methyltransferase
MRKARRLALRGASIIDGLANRLNGRTPYPPIYLRREVGPLRTFEVSAASMIGELEFRAGLGPDSRLLDMGCGCGAIPLVMLGYGTHVGSYIGLDVDQQMIDWCKAHIASDKFSFAHHDYWSATYNPAGTRYLPFAAGDDWADVIVMKSVFTHLLPDDIDWYLQETARVLAPEGTAILTVVLYNEDDRDIMVRFPHEGDDGIYRFARPESPESSIAVSRTWMDEQMLSAGLSYQYTPGTVQGPMLVRHRH